MPPYNPMAYMAAASPSYDMPGSTVSPVMPDPVLSYVDAALGQGPLEFDSQGRYGITEDQRRSAQWGAAREILTGIAESMLGSDPTRMVARAASAGDAYQAGLDKASARNIANRSLEFQEAAARLQLDKGLTERERDRMLIDEQKRLATEREELRVLTHDTLDAASKDILDDLPGAIERGEMTSGQADAVRGHIKSALAYARLGEGERAQAMIDQVTSSVPSYMVEKVTTKIQTGELVNSVLEKRGSTIRIDPATGEFYDIEKRSLDIAGKKADLRQSNQAIRESQARIANMEADNKRDADRAARDAENAAVEMQKMVGGLVSAGRSLSASTLTGPQSSTKMLEKYADEIRALESVASLDEATAIEALKALGREGEGSTTMVLSLLSDPDRRADGLRMLDNIMKRSSSPNATSVVMNTSGRSDKASKAFSTLN